MLFTETRGRPVMNTSTATTEGKISHPLVDPHTSRVVGFALSKTHGKANTLHWEDLRHFGPDAVTVDSADAVAEPRGRAAELSAKHMEILGKRVLTDQGDELGEVDDLHFDPDSGEVVALVTAAGPLEAERMIGLGSYALIIKA